MQRAGAGDAIRKNKLICVVRYRDPYGVLVLLSPGPKPKNADGDDCWFSSEEETKVCYLTFKKATGLCLKIDEPVRVRFSAEPVDA